MREQTWVPVPPNSPFPIQNLPLGVFEHPSGEAHVGAAIGDHILDLTALEADGLLARGLFGEGTLNRFLAEGRSTWSAVRQVVRDVLLADEPRPQYLVKQSDVRMRLPVKVGDYTDFYSSKEHATNVGAMLRGPDNALMPNWLHLPVAYHGRASSVVISGTDVRRPRGQTKPESAASPLYGPTQSLDFELEMGAIVGTGNPMGEAIPIDRAEEHAFGLVLVNDWSARDIQAWEYQPLGPFLAKNFATSISPWVVPLEALEPFRVEGPKQDPEPLPYLRQSGRTTFDIQLEVRLNGHVISKSNYRHLYWSLRQQVAHHTVNGCPLRPGDLLASGTISGPTPDSRGCLLELTWRGTKPLTLPDGQTRRFLEDGDRVTMAAWCEGDGYRVGLGEVTGVVLPALGEPRTK
ncbi:MAG: fumarylacetoacetase [Gemmataceae bacterium]